MIRGSVTLTELKENYRSVTRFQEKKKEKVVIAQQMKH
jgi:hypothetical protein